MRRAEGRWPLAGPILTGVVLAGVVLAAAVGLWWRLRHPPPERLVLRAAHFSNLAGWTQDDIAAAIPALLESCNRRLREPPGRAPGVAGTAADWASACQVAAALPPGDAAAARHFFEARFAPLLVTNRGRARGLFTGYFEISVKGSLTQDAQDPVPIYARPPDLVTADLGNFRPSLKGMHIAGRVVNGALEPYPDRAAIARGALKGRGLELAWLADPVDAFFLEVQGSGRIELPGGGAVTVGYAAQNGRPYVAIGRVLLEQGALKRGDVSLQTIRAWLAAHPAQAQAVMDRNPSYVFFRKLAGGQPIGAEGVPLTPRRSLAIDRRFLPLGVPVWLDTVRPAETAGEPDRPLRRLLVTQDTGGAIRGPVRGDVYWGAGPAAAAIAGRMQSLGRYWLLLPKAVAARDLSRPR